MFKDDSIFVLNIIFIKVWAITCFINSINVWVPQYSRLVLLPLLRLAAESIVAVMILAFLLSMSPLAFLMLFILIGCATFLYERLLRKRNLTHANEFRRVSTEVITDVRQAMDGIKEVRVLGAEDFFSNRILTNSKKLCIAQAGSNSISNSVRYFLETTIVIFAVIIPLLISKNYGGTAIDTIPLVAIFGVGAMRLMTLFNLVAICLTQLRFYRKIVGSLYADLISNFVVNINRPKEKVEDTCHIERVEVKELYFRYQKSGGNLILHGVNLNIIAGQKIAILGPSGSGKSTLIDLLLGILSSEKGEISVYDDSGKKIASSLAPFSVYLPQATFLIDDTVRRNIALGRLDNQIDELKLKDALIRSKLFDTVNFLPEGLDTKIGDRGIRLSGGQRQRIAIARAIYFGRTVLILDESTNAIDAQTEEEILDDLLSNDIGLTVIQITHRRDLAQKFDRLFYIDSGSLKEVSKTFR
jgi:ATP-binding cassette subfamily C protein